MGIWSKGYLHLVEHDKSEIRNPQSEVEGVLRNALRAGRRFIRAARQRQPHPVVRTNLPFLKFRQAVNLAETGTDVRIEWTAYTGTVTVDPVTQATIGTSARMTMVARAFAHFVQVATSQVRQFNEVEAGDCILDFAADVSLEGKVDLVFTLLDQYGQPIGNSWVPKQVSDRLGQTWDVVVGGQRLYRSVLLRKQT
jgi:hypothetical protein